MLALSGADMNGLEYNRMEKTIIRTLEINGIMKSLTDRDRSFIRDHLVSKPHNHNADFTNLYLEVIITSTFLTLTCSLTI